MLIGELSDVFNAVIADYHRFGIERVIRHTITVLSWKGTPDASAYPDEAYRLKAESDLIIGEEHELLQTSRAKGIFAASLFANLLPGDIARQIRSFLTVDIALSAPTTEAQFLLLRFQSVKSLIEGFVQVAGGLGFYPFQLPGDRITLSLRLPDELFGSDLTRLGDTIRVVDDFFGEVAEQSSGVRSRPTFHYAADASLTLYLSIEPRHAAPLMLAVRACTEAARSAAAFETALGEIRKAEVPAELLDQAIMSHETTRATHLGRALETALDASADPGREAVRSRDVTRLIGLCLRMARYMEQGLDIHLVRPLDFSGLSLLSAESALGPAVLHRLMAGAITARAEPGAVRTADSWSPERDALLPETQIGS